MPDVQQLLELDDFEDEIVVRLEFQVERGLFDLRLKFAVTFSRHVQGREEIPDETHEHGHVLNDDFGYVEVAQRSHQNLTKQSTYHAQKKQKNEKIEKKNNLLDPLNGLYQLASAHRPQPIRIWWLVSPLWQKHYPTGVFPANETT